ncbi:hypothetical protein DLK06_15845 [Acinetobacter pittii]|uniref:Uncharacterized protein n=1 Tax=Acinetobacter pittii TaxID=48296 RepID=A0AAE9M6S2_ACIPI|nr:hypothetical protein [Acinetobacter pittii]AZP30428.1 hypothetical protein DLK06_15845 [Acinetobacter pittii]USU93812.1 hypothetical protein MWH18_15885 [Acinetobacter pittii]
MFVDEINIAFPILLVNRESDIFIEIPIFCVLIDKRKPTVVVGYLEFIEMSKENIYFCLNMFSSCGALSFSIFTLGRHTYLGFFFGALSLVFFLVFIVALIKT